MQFGVEHRILSHTQNTLDWKTATSTIHPQYIHNGQGLRWCNMASMLRVID